MVPVSDQMISFLLMWTGGHFMSSPHHLDKGDVGEAKRITRANGYDRELSRTPIYRGMTVPSDRSARELFRILAEDGTIELHRVGLESWSTDPTVAAGHLSASLKREGYGAMGILLSRPNPIKGTVVMNLASGAFWEDVDEERLLDDYDFVSDEPVEFDEDGEIIEEDDNDPLGFAYEEKEVVVEQQGREYGHKDIEAVVMADVEPEDVERTARSLEERGWLVDQLSKPGSKTTLAFIGKRKSMAYFPIKSGWQIPEREMLRRLKRRPRK